MNRPLHDPAGDLMAALPILRTATHVDAIRVLCDVLEKVLTDVDAKSFEQEIGLARPGPKPARQSQTARRDAAVQHVWRTCYRDLSARPAAGVISKAWHRYAADRHPHQHLIPVEEPAASFYALAVAGHRPLSTESLRKILAKTEASASTAGQSLPAVFDPEAPAS